MNNCLDRISQIKSLRAEESELSEKRVKLESPLFEDTGYIPVMFKWFCELSDDFQIQGRLSAQQRTEFLMVVVLIYSPMTLFGKPLKNGIRDLVAEVFRCKSPSVVSNILKDDLRFQYEHNKDIKKNVDYFCEIVIERLKELNLISPDYIS